MEVTFSDPKPVEYSNTPFTLFWQAVNAALRARGHDEMLYGTAHQLWADTVNTASAVSFDNKMKAAGLSS